MNEPSRNHVPDKSTMTPENISKALSTLLDRGEKAQIVFQTEWKPSQGTPFVWIALTNSRVVIFSSRHGGMKFRALKFAEINAVQSEDGGRSVRILHWDTDTPDLHFPVAKTVEPQTVADFVSQASARLAHQPKAAPPQQNSK